MPASAQISCIEVWWKPERAKQRLRSSEDFAAAVGRELDIGPAHEWCPAIK